MKIEYPDAQFIMRVHKGDLIRLGNGSEDSFFRVVRLSAKANTLYLADHKE